MFMSTIVTELEGKEEALFIPEEGVVMHTLVEANPASPEFRFYVHKAKNTIVGFKIEKEKEVSSTTTPSNSDSPHSLTTSPLSEKGEKSKIFFSDRMKTKPHKENGRGNTPCETPNLGSRETPEISFTLTQPILAPNKPETLLRYRGINTSTPRPPHISPPSDRENYRLLND